MTNKEYDYCGNCKYFDCGVGIIRPCHDCIHRAEERFKLADGKEPPPTEGILDEAKLDGMLLVDAIARINALERAIKTLPSICRVCVNNEKEGNEDPCCNCSGFWGNRTQNYFQFDYERFSKGENIG